MSKSDNIRREIVRILRADDLVEQYTGTRRPTVERSARVALGRKLAALLVELAAAEEGQSDPDPVQADVFARAIARGNAGNQARDERVASLTDFATADLFRAAIRNRDDWQPPSNAEIDGATDEEIRAVGNWLDDPSLKPPQVLVNWNIPF